MDKEKINAMVRQALMMCNFKGSMPKIKYTNKGVMSSNSVFSTININEFHPLLLKYNELLRFCIRHEVGHLIDKANHLHLIDLVVILLSATTILKKRLIPQLLSHRYIPFALPILSTGYAISIYRRFINCEYTANHYAIDVSIKCGDYNAISMMLITKNLNKLNILLDIKVVGYAHAQQMKSLML